MNVKATISKPNDKNVTYVEQKKFDIQNGQYGIWENKGDSFVFVPKGSAVYIAKVVNHTDRGDKILLLHFFDAQGCRVEVDFPRRELTEQGIMELLAYGAQVTKQTAQALIGSILNQEPKAACILQHESLGFSVYNKEKVFLAKKAIGVDSEYKGKLQIGRKGKFSLWKKMIREEIVGNIPLEFILSVGASSVIVDYLREKVQVENIIVSMVSESSQGKTTAGLLLVSCGAKPSFQGDSLVLNFSDTPNALMATIQSGFPVLIDEGSLCRYNPTNLLYSLSMGKEKKRLNKELVNMESSFFNTAIAITSEKSLIEMADENSGLLVRVLEITNVMWTKDAESADKIKSVIHDNYGWLVPKLAERVLELEKEEGQEAIVCQYWEWQKRFVQDAKEQGYYNNLTERASKQYALILLSASLIQNLLKIELHLDEIVHFIEHHSPVRESPQADIGERAFLYLIQYVSKFYTQFIRPDDDGFVPQNCLGRIKNIRKIMLRNGLVAEKQLLISDITLQKILQEGSFPDKKIVLGKWKETGYLKSEKDRYLSDIRIIGDMSVKGYVINIPSTLENNIEINSRRKNNENSNTI